MMFEFINERSYMTPASTPVCSEISTQTEEESTINILQDLSDQDFKAVEIQDDDPQVKQPQVEQPQDDEP